MADDQNSNQFGRSGRLKNGNKERQLDSSYGRGFHIRHLQATVMAVAALVAYSHRINLSVAIVGMVRQKKDENSQAATDDELAPTFDWGEDIQGYLLSSFFWGYMILQIPAGIITERYGAHRFLCGAVITSSILTILIPQCAFMGGWFLVCMNRMCQGLSQGFLFPSIYTLLGLWCPPCEISRMTSVAVGAQFLGIVITTPVSGYFVKIYGWPMVFYAFGGFGVVLGIIMIFLGADSPAKHRMISEGERRYIESSLGGAKMKLSVPWKQALTSVPYLSALQVATFYCLGYFILLTKVPTYLATVLNFSIEENGVLSALPYLVAYILSFVFSGACDYIIDKKLLNLTTARKLFNSIAHFGSAICIVLMGHVENRVVAVVLLCINMGCQASTYAGVNSNFVDLAPNFAGSIFSVANFTSAFLGLVGPILVGFIVTETGSIVQWRIVFYICSAVLILSNLLYMFWGSAETQWWNWPERYSCEEDYEKDPEKKKEILPHRNAPRLSLV